MSNDNRFEPTLDACNRWQPKKRSFFKRFIFGFMLGALPPALFGVGILYGSSVDQATALPGEMGCGLVVAGAIFSIIFLAPISGLICSAFALMMP